MACESENDWLDARIAKVKSMIEAIEDAIIAISGGAQSYTLDTSQTRQSVTKSDLGSLRTQLRDLYSLYDTLRSRRCGGGSYGVPGW